MALERRKLLKVVKRKEAASSRDTTKLRKSALDKLSTIRRYLAQIQTWSVPVDSLVRRDTVYDDIIAVERQDGLTYPAHTLLQLFFSLMTLRHHAVECAVKNTELQRLPVILSGLFENEFEVQGRAQDETELLRSIVSRFTNLTCKSLQRTFCARASEHSAQLASQAQDATVALRPRLAVKSPGASMRVTIS